MWRHIELTRAIESHGAHQSMEAHAVSTRNVVISGIFWKGTPFEILKAWQGGRFQLAISPPILDEYRRVLEEMTEKRPSVALGSILQLVELHSEMAEPVRFAKSVCCDPDDDKFLEAAIAASAGTETECSFSRLLGKPVGLRSELSAGGSHGAIESYGFKGSETALVRRYIFAHGPSYVGAT